MGCGLGLRTGAVAGAPLPAREKAQTTYTFPFVKLLVTAGIVGALVAGWFFLAVPPMSKLRMSRGVGYVTNGDLKKAVEYFGKNRESLAEGDRPRADLLVQQLGLEMRLFRVLCRCPRRCCGWRSVRHPSAARLGTVLGSPAF